MTMINEFFKYLPTAIQTGKFLGEVAEDIGIVSKVPGLNLLQKCSTPLAVLSLPGVISNTHQAYQRIVSGNTQNTNDDRLALAAGALTALNLASMVFAPELQTLRYISAIGGLFIDGVRLNTSFNNGNLNEAALGILTLIVFNFDRSGRNNFGNLTRNLKLFEMPSLNTTHAFATNNSHGMTLNQTKAEHWTPSTAERAQTQTHPLIRVIDRHYPFGSTVWAVHKTEPRAFQCERRGLEMDDSGNLFVYLSSKTQDKVDPKVPAELFLAWQEAASAFRNRPCPHKAIPTRLEPSEHNPWRIRDGKTTITPVNRSSKIELISAEAYVKALHPQPSIADEFPNDPILNEFPIGTVVTYPFRGQNKPCIVTDILSLQLIQLTPVQAILDTIRLNRMNSAAKALEKRNDMPTCISVAPENLRAAIQSLRGNK